MRKETRRRVRVRRGGTSGAGDNPGLRPHELLLKVVRAEAVDGHKPSFAERLAAARQVLPYDLPRLAPQSATGEDGKKLRVWQIVRFAELPPEEQAIGLPAPRPDTQGGGGETGAGETEGREGGG